MSSRPAVLLCPLAAILVWTFSPASLVAQATPAYIAEMPSVDRVMQAMQASDPDETAARQMGAFWQLKTMIEEIAGPRYYRPGLTPEEAKLRQAYNTAYFQSLSRRRNTSPSSRCGAMISVLNSAMN